MIREEDAESLISVFKTIPGDEYNGSDSDLCLVGYPLNKGVLKEEWSAYNKSFLEFPQQEPWLTATEWLAKRFNVDPYVLACIYSDVSEISELEEDVDMAIEYAYDLLSLYGN